MFVFCVVLISVQYCHPVLTVRYMRWCSNCVAKFLQFLKLYSGQPRDLFFEECGNSTPSALLKVRKSWDFVMRSFCVTATFYTVAKPLKKVLWLKVEVHRLL